MLDPVGVTRPNARQKVCLQLEPDREPVVFSLTDATARPLHTLRNAEQILHVMSNLVSDHVRLREIAACTQPFLELTEKTEVDVHAAILRTVERTGRATGKTAARLSHVRKQN